MTHNNYSISMSYYYDYEKLLYYSTQDGSFAVLEHTMFTYTLTPTMIPVLPGWNAFSCPSS